MVPFYTWIGRENNGKFLEILLKLVLTLKVWYSKCYWKICIICSKKQSMPIQITFLTPNWTLCSIKCTLIVETLLSCQLPVCVCINPSTKLLLYFLRLFICRYICTGMSTSAICSIYFFNKKTFIPFNNYHSKYPATFFFFSSSMDIVLNEIPNYINTKSLLPSRLNFGHTRMKLIEFHFVTWLLRIFKLVSCIAMSRSMLSLLRKFASMIGGSIWGNMWTMNFTDLRKYWAVAHAWRLKIGFKQGTAKMGKLTIGQ